MSDQPSTPTTISPVPDPTTPSTQAKKKRRWRDSMPEWIKQLPYLNLPKADPNYQLVKIDELNELMRGLDHHAQQRVRDDIAFLEQELLRLFRQRDSEAALQQNRYRKYQIGFISLATVATIIGGLQALYLGTAPRVIPYLAFAETLIALMATYLATISGREPPFPAWMNNRRRAESLRREYFRYLINLPPYDAVLGYERRMLLSRRAADINRGVFPEQEGPGGGAK